MIAHSSAFTQSYSQPESYHFCQDSVIAPRLIADDLASSLNGSRGLRALDLCAGCGVMGLELLHALGDLSRAIATFDFLEIQREFEPHFHANAQCTTDRNPKSEITKRWINQDYNRLSRVEFAESYDLIIANPPYFSKGEGTLGPSDLSNRARFFLDSDLQTLFRAVRNALAPKGLAYLLVKSGKEHGRDAFTSARLEFFNFRVERLADVRGTDLLKITHS